MQNSRTLGGSHSALGSHRKAQNSDTPPLRPRRSSLGSVSETAKNTLPLRRKSCDPAPEGNLEEHRFVLLRASGAKAKSPLDLLMIAAQEFIQDSSPSSRKGSWSRRVSKDPLTNCRRKLQSVCLTLLKLGSKSLRSNPLSAVRTFVADYDKDFRNDIEALDGAGVSQIEEFVLLARKVTETVVFDESTPIIPHVRITEEVERFKEYGVAGLRFESVPSNDYTQMLGPHCDDMISALRFEDGSLSIVATDGEGSLPRSDAFSHLFNKAVQIAWLENRAAVVKALSKSKREAAMELMEQVLRRAVNRGLADMRKHVVGKELDPRARETQGASTLAAAMTVADPRNPEVCWVVGINIYDSPVVVIEPDTGLITVHQKTVINSNVDTSCGDYAAYQRITKKVALPETFVSQHRSNALVVVMTDGVTDCLPKLARDAEQEEQNEQLAKALKAVVCNPYFDSTPLAAVPKNMTLEDLTALGMGPKTPLKRLKPGQISRRIENFVKWRCSDLRRAQEVVNSIAALIERQRVLREGNLTGLMCREKTGTTVRILPEGALRDFALKTQRSFGDISETLDIKRLADEKLSEREDQKCREMFPAMDSLPDLVMVPLQQLEKLMESQVAALWVDEGAKTDGVSIIAARAIHRV